MGMPGPCSKSCFTNCQATAPNPSPERWTMLDKQSFNNGYVLKVKYHDCTNFEGVKIIVFRGVYREWKILDPHFSESYEAPIARFKPDDEGWRMAVELAKSL
jgi:hypothetical protein